MTAANGQTDTQGNPPPRAGFREVLGLGEYQALWGGYALSVMGDQFARVALTVLVYNRTHSALWTAVTYAGTFLPWLLGGPILARLADVRPRKTVLVCCDLARCVLVALILLPGLPLAAMVALVFAVTLFQAPYLAARSATIRDVLPDNRRYATAVAFLRTSTQLATVIGFAAGGILVGAIGARPALGIDAITFAVSAVLTQILVTYRPAVRKRGEPMSLKLPFTNTRLRTFMLFGWLAGFYAVPDALAGPYAADLHGGATTVGLIFAVGPLGGALGSAAYGRLASSDRQIQETGPLAALACGTLILCFTRPGITWLLVIIFVSGIFTCYQIGANTGFVMGLPPSQRGLAFGVANSGLWTAQGLASLAAGAAATIASPAVVIALSGLLGVITATGLAIGGLHRKGLGPTEQYEATPRPGSA